MSPEYARDASRRADGEVWAEDSGSDGPPVVLLHPGVGDSRIWEPVLPALTASYRVIRYDARGFDRAAIVGCSQGGGSALGLALEQRARVTALVLLCPGVPGYPWPSPSPLPRSPLPSPTFP